MSGVFLFDKNLSLIDTIAGDVIRDPYYEAELNGLIRAQLTIKYRDLDAAHYFGFKDGDNFQVHAIRNFVKKDGFLTVHGIHLMFDELKGKVVRDLRPTQKIPGFALGEVLKETGWQCVSHVDNLASATFYHISALEALYKICSAWGVEFKPVIKFADGKIVAKEIHLYQSIGDDLGRVFSYGHNLVTVTAESNRDNLYTAFIGRGKGEEAVNEKGVATGGYGRKIKFTDIDFTATKDGISVHSPRGCDYIEIKEATAAYGYPDGSPRIGVVDFDNIEDKTELARATFDYALENARPKVQLKASGLQVEQVGLGEVVAIIADMGIRYKTRVYKIKRDFLRGAVVSFEFGDKIVKTTADRLRTSADEKKAEEIRQSDYLEQVLRAIESTYYNEDGYQYDLKANNEYNLPAGIYSFDRPIDKDPTKVVYLGAGKLMIADSKREDGTWRFRTAIDGESVNADQIRTGILQGGRVYWNLMDGTFRIGESTEKFSMLWDGETLKLRNVDLDIANSKEIKAINDSINKLDQDVAANATGISEVISQIKATADEISSEITSQTKDLDGKISKLNTKITQTSDSISTKVSKDGVISAINQSSESIRIQASKINLDGDVSLTGEFKTYNDDGVAVRLHDQYLDFYESYKENVVLGTIGVLENYMSGVHSLDLSHKKNSHLSISYEDEGSVYAPYIEFDKYNRWMEYGHPVKNRSVITVFESTYFKEKVIFNGNAHLNNKVTIGLDTSFDEKITFGRDTHFKEKVTFSKDTYFDDSVVCSGVSCRSLNVGPLSIVTTGTGAFIDFFRSNRRFHIDFVNGRTYFEYFDE